MTDFDLSTQDLAPDSGAFPDDNDQDFLLEKCGLSDAVPASGASGMGKPGRAVKPDKAGHDQTKPDISGKSGFGKATPSGTGLPGHTGTNRDISPRFVMIEDFCKLPPKQAWTIRRYLEPDTLGVLYGESQSFKSFIAIDLIGHVATGRAWRGNKTKQGLCIYVAGEGGNGLAKRFKAWFQYHGEAMRNIAVSTVPLALCDPLNVDALVVDVLALLAELRQQALVIVLDTLSTHFGPGDENKTSEMRAFMQGIRRLRMETGATILVIHHVGHGSKERERGSISLAQDVDWRYRVERQPETMITTLVNMKSRDAERPGPQSWNLQPVELPWVDEDEDGQLIPMSSLVPVPVDAVEPVEKPEYLPKAQRVAMDALRSALIAFGVEDKGVVSVGEDQWREAAYAAGISRSTKQDTKRQAFVRAKDELIEAGKVRCHEGRFWIPRPTPDKTRQNQTFQKMSGLVGDAVPRQNQTYTVGMSGYVGVCGDPDISEEAF